MKVPYIQLGLQHEPIKKDILSRIEGLLDTGKFILGESVEEFEKKFAELHKVKYAVGVANGTDALVMALKAICVHGDDEVITCPNSYLASGSSIVLAGAKPVFCDVDDSMNMDPESLKQAITEKTRAIIPVHLTGKPANMDEIMRIADENKLEVIEDAAQAVGASYHGKPVGGFGRMACFSLHPLKNLSACGDGGVITTNDDRIYKHLLAARNHGLVNRDECEFFSPNSRLDAMQAEVLNVKMDHIENWNARRREIAQKYSNAFRSVVRVPDILEDEYAVFHTYIIQTKERDALKAFLAERGVDTKIHYPIPIHQQKAWNSMFQDGKSFPKTEKQSKEILSLPIFPELTNEEVEYVIQCVGEFFNS